jgi:hypothetical protein
MEAAKEAGEKKEISQQLAYHNTEKNNRTALTHETQRHCTYTE